jgi:hypothetical protein
LSIDQLPPSEVESGDEWLDMPADKQPADKQQPEENEEEEQLQNHKRKLTESKSDQADQVAEAETTPKETQAKRTRTPSTRVVESIQQKDLPAVPLPTPKLHDLSCEDPHQPAKKATVSVCTFSTHFIYRKRVTPKLYAMQNKCFC